jgi:hypothetical protein
MRTVVGYLITLWCPGFSDRLAPNLVLKVVGVMRLTHGAFEVFVDPALDLVQFVELGFF